MGEVCPEMLNYERRVQNQNDLPPRRRNAATPPDQRGEFKVSTKFAQTVERPTKSARIVEHFVGQSDLQKLRKPRTISRG